MCREVHMMVCFIFTISTRRILSINSCFHDTTMALDLVQGNGRHQASLFPHAGWTSTRASKYKVLRGIKKPKEVCWQINKMTWWYLVNVHETYWNFISFWGSIRQFHFSSGFLLLSDIFKNSIRSFGVLSKEDMAVGKSKKVAAETCADQSWRLLQTRWLLLTGGVEWKLDPWCSILCRLRNSSGVLNNGKLWKVAYFSPNCVWGKEDSSWLPNFHCQVNREMSKRTSKNKDVHAFSGLKFLSFRFAGGGWPSTSNGWSFIERGGCFAPDFLRPPNLEATCWLLWKACDQLPERSPGIKCPTGTTHFLNLFFQRFVLLFLFTFLFSFVFTH